MISHVHGLTQIHNPNDEITYSKKEVFDAFFIVFSHNKTISERHQDTHDRFKLYFVKRFPS